jgi:hypothetical protein
MPSIRRLVAMGLRINISEIFKVTRLGAQTCSVARENQIVPAVLEGVDQ